MFPLFVEEGQECLVHDELDRRLASYPRLKRGGRPKPPRGVVRIAQPDQLCSFRVKGLKIVVGRLGQPVIGIGSYVQRRVQILGEGRLRNGYSSRQASSGDGIDQLCRPVADHDLFRHDVMIGSQPSGQSRAVAIWIAGDPIKLLPQGVENASRRTQRIDVDAEIDSQPSARQAPSSMPEERGQLDSRTAHLVHAAAFSHLSDLRVGERGCVSAPSLGAPTQPRSPRYDRANDHRRALPGG